MEAKRDRRRPKVSITLPSFMTEIPGSTLSAPWNYPKRRPSTLRPNRGRSRAPAVGERNFSCRLRYTRRIGLWNGKNSSRKDRHNRNDYAAGTQKIEGFFSTRPEKNGKIGTLPPKSQDGKGRWSKACYRGVQTGNKFFRTAGPGMEPETQLPSGLGERERSARPRKEALSTFWPSKPGAPGTPCTSGSHFPRIHGYSVLATQPILPFYGV